MGELRMNPRITVSLTALIATIIAVYLPQIGESGAGQIAALVVSFAIGWVTRTPGSPPPPAAPTATFPAGGK
jgi:hypothetical protein